MQIEIFEDLSRVGNPTAVMIQVGKDSYTELFENLTDEEEAWVLSKDYLKGEDRPATLGWSFPDSFWQLPATEKEQAMQGLRTTIFDFLQEATKNDKV